MSPRSLISNFRIPNASECLQAIAIIAGIFGGVLAYDGAKTLTGAVLGIVIVAIGEAMIYFAVKHFACVRWRTDMSFGEIGAAVLSLCVAIGCSMLAIQGSVVGFAQAQQNTVSAQQDAISGRRAQAETTYQQQEAARIATKNTYQAKFDALDNRRDPKDWAKMAGLVDKYSTPLPRPAANRPAEAVEAVAPQQYKIAIPSLLYLSIFFCLLLAAFDEKSRAEKAEKASATTPATPAPTNGGQPVDPAQIVAQERQEHQYDLVDGIADGTVQANADGHVSVAQIVKHTGCSNAEARAAQEQAFSEGFLVDNGKTGGARRFFCPQPIAQGQTLRAVS